MPSTSKHPILAVARLRYGQEHQRRKAAVRRRGNHGEELVGPVIDRPLQERGPEAGDIVSAQRVDDDMAESDGHDDAFLSWLVGCASGATVEPATGRL
jgi:hypothetical protein